MKQIRIQNVRSLRDTGMVPITGITLLVGENSSGKSTFLRMFPLIRQSISKRTDGPLLWAGDVDDYVDFGSFSETVTNDGADCITLHFAFDLPHTKSFTTIGYFSMPWWVNPKEVKSNKIVYSVTIKDRNQSGNPKKWSGYEYVSNLKVKINETIFDFVLNPTPFQGSVSVDGTKMSNRNSGKAEDEQLHGIFLRKSKYVFGLTLPFISGLNNNFLKGLLDIYLKHGSVDEKDSKEYLHYSVVSSASAIMQHIGEMLCRGKVWDEIVQSLEKDVQELEKGTLMMQILTSCIKKLQAMDEQERSDMLQKSKLLYFYGIYDHIDEYLDSYFRQAHYIAPLRATAERYYRQRNLAIDEVDYQGKNLPIFLNGLTAPRLKEFQNWTQKFFGFKVLVDKKSGHLSVKIATITKEGVNLSDTGFGYSQILPIITQLWDLSTRSKRPKSDGSLVPLVVAIEQPELHLHPGLQAKLAKAFIASIQLAKENGYQLQLLLETHSETIVNYFGRAIARKEIKKEDMSVLLFEKSIDAHTAEVRTCGYDEDGYLTDWPIGFFAPEE